MSLTVHLHDAAGNEIGTATIPDARAIPRLVVLSPLDGSHRFFIRAGRETDDEFHEALPVVCEPNG